jgi:hypothetical protein
MKTTAAAGIREDRPERGDGPISLESEISESGTGHRGAAMMRIAQNEKPACQRAFVKLCQTFGAGEGARTLDPDLGKVVLYH